MLAPSRLFVRFRQRGWALWDLVDPRMKKQALGSS